MTTCRFCNAEHGEGECVNTPRTDAAISQRRYYEQRGAWHGDDVLLYVEPEDSRSIERELMTELADQYRELASLRAKVGMLQANSDRYEELRRQHESASPCSLAVFAPDSEKESEAVMYPVSETPGALDAAIDSAIERSKQP